MNSSWVYGVDTGMEAMRPDVVACLHHLGRWRLDQESGGDRWSTALADLQEVGLGRRASIR